MRKARYQWVRCNPDGNSANCIEEKGPTFNLLPGESEGILPLRTDPSSMIRPQKSNYVISPFEDYFMFGSGSGSGSESGSGFGSGLIEIEEEY